MSAVLRTSGRHIKGGVRLRKKSFAFRSIDNFARYRLLKSIAWESSTSEKETNSVHAIYIILYEGYELKVESMMT